MPKKALIITLVILGLAAYTAGSFWVIGMIQQGTIPLPFTKKQTMEANATNTAQTNFPGATQTTQHPTSIPTPIPTPTPLQGPGRYACDADGICGDFSDERRQSCPKTFADFHCLGMCGTPSVRCSK